jgi:hypothetical protein
MKIDSNRFFLTKRRGVANYYYLKRYTKGGDYAKSSL